MSEFPAAVMITTLTSDSTNSPTIRLTKSSIILVSRPSRRRESLLALLRSLPGAPQILCIDTFGAKDNLPDLKGAALVILDHTLNKVEQRYSIQDIRRQAPQTWILLLVIHPNDAFAFEDARPNSVLHDGFSYASLMGEIQKAFPSL